MQSEYIYLLFKKKNYNFVTEPMKDALSWNKLQFTVVECTQLTTIRATLLCETHTHTHTFRSDRHFIQSLRSACKHVGAGGDQGGSGKCELFARCPAVVSQYIHTVAEFPSSPKYCNCSFYFHLVYIMDGTFLCRKDFFSPQSVLQM